MNLIFVHGLGGEEGGPLERSLEEEVRRGEHQLFTVRWHSGTLRNMAGATLWSIAKEATLEHNPWRLAIGVLLRIQRDGQQRWDSALANATHASQKLLTVMNLFAEKGEPFSVVGFSLGGRILMSTLRSAGDPGPCLHRVVFAAAAVAGASFEHLAPSLLADKRTVNIYSETDEVLSTFYPMVHGLDGAAGTAPAKVPGVHNVKLEAGHLSYAKLGRKIIALATE